MYKTERDKVVSVNSQMQHSVLFNSLCFPKMNAKQVNFLTLYFCKTGGKLEKGKNGGEMFFVRCRLHASLEKYVIVAWAKFDSSFT